MSTLGVHRDADAHEASPPRDAPIGLRLALAAEAWPEREALVFEETRLTFAQLGAWHESVASFLCDAHVEPGDRVLWQLPNLPDALALHLAILRMGAVSMPVPMLYRQHELTHIVREAKPAAVITVGAYRGRDPISDLGSVLAEQGVHPKLLGSVGSSAGRWAELPACGDLRGTHNRARLPRPLDGEEPVLILYTSGSTANPKGVVHSSASLNNLAFVMRDWFGFSPADRFITGAPVAHIAGLLITGIVPLVCGATAVLMAQWDPVVATQLADKERATFSCGATVFLQEFVETYETGPPVSHPLSMFMCGGATISPDLIERAERVGVCAFRSWGMTEAPTIGLATVQDQLDMRARTDGRICPGAEVEAVDHRRRPLGRGREGELRVRAGQRMIGYTDPALNDILIDRDGWYYSGDTGIVSSDGCVTMTGRIKDIINRGGEKFSAQDIENVVMTHPAVRAAAILAVADRRLGEEVACFVQLQSDADWPGAEALYAHLDASHLARQKFPKYWQVVDALPLTASGKVKKDVLLRIWEAQTPPKHNEAAGSKKLPEPKKQ